MEAIPILNISVWIIVKIFVLIGLFVYFIFSLVVLRQVNIMTDTLDVGFELPVKILALLHFFFALAILVFAGVVL